MKPRICLNMIVKNEAAVIARCLASVRPWIDTWCIIDTGSSDATMDIIRHTMADLPGRLYERPWRDFGTNRSEALELASSLADYLLIIDADEILQAEPGFSWPELNADAYRIKSVFGTTHYYRTQVIATGLKWRYVGILHEYLECDKRLRQLTIEGLINIPSTDGARSKDPAKYVKDAQLLEAALAKDPSNRRYQFYLGQSYRDAKMPAQSKRAYLARAQMGGWDEEVWYSLYQAAKLSIVLDEPQAAVTDAFLRAYDARPTRAEPLCYLARYLRLRKHYSLAHLFAAKAAALQMPNDLLFLDAPVYDWIAQDEQAIAGYYIGAHHEAIALNTALLMKSMLTQTQRARIQNNLQLSQRALGEAA